MEKNRLNNSLFSFKKSILIIVQITLLYVLFFSPGNLHTVLSENSQKLIRVNTLWSTLIISFIHVCILLSLVHFDPLIPDVNNKITGQDLIPVILLAGVLLSGTTIILFFVNMLPANISNNLIKHNYWQPENLKDLPLSILIIIFAAYREELYFRHYLLNSLKNILPLNWISIITSSLIFGMGHLYQGLVPAGISFIIAIWFCILYENNYSIHRLAGAHIMFNTCVIGYGLFA